LICEVCPKGAQLIEFLHCIYVIIDSTIKKLCVFGASLKYMMATTFVNV